MHRWLILFLVSLLPLQVSWAVAANYCEHEQGKATHHFGHHQDEHEHHAVTDVDSSNPQPGDDSSLGHCHDHLSGFVALLLNGATASVDVSASPQLQTGEPSLAVLPPGQPERPNWLAPA